MGLVYVRVQGGSGDMVRTLEALSFVNPIVMSHRLNPFGNYPR